MNELVIQVRPQRLPSFADAGIAQLQSAGKSLADEVQLREDDDKERTINLIFAVGKADALWKALQAQIATLGWQDGVIAACTGEAGWADYKLLHHYDPKVIGG